MAFDDSAIYFVSIKPDAGVFLTEVDRIPL